MATSGSRLPPLNGLRAFEVAARHLSFTRAAEELHVTPAAVGQQVRALERFLGIDLFERMHRNLRLTDAGRNCLPELQAGFRKLGDAVDRMRAAQSGGTLVVSVEPDFAARWLVRRLDRFNSSHPDVDVRLDATLRLVDMAREEVDVAVRYGAGTWPGLHAEPLFDDEMFPVCSPCLLEGQHPLRRPQDLAHHTLLHEYWGEQDDDAGWRNWLRAAAVDGVDPERGPRFAQHSLMLEAAAQGHGVALASGILAADDLASGRLVCPFGAAGRTAPGFAYYLVWNELRRERPAALAFRQWLLGEAAGQRSLYEKAE